MDKHSIRWELAHISNQLNCLLKDSTEHRHSATQAMEIIHLREQRERLLQKLATL